MLERIFKLRERGATVSTEVLGGLTTFLTMAYVIFVNPAILSTDFAGNMTGLSFDAALVGTCFAAAVATFLMGVYANFPIAQAPGMGENFFFVTVVMALGAQGIANSWQVALGVVFISGLVFLLLSLLRFRKAIIDAISPSMKNGIAVGIGFFIAFIGLRNGGLIVASQGTAVAFARNLLTPEILIFLFGLLFTAVLHTRRVRGAILWGIAATTIAALAAGEVQYTGIFGLPHEHAFFKLDILGALKLSVVPFIVIFLFMDLFDTVGTIIGVSEQAGFMEDNKLPGGNRALVSDAVGTVVGSLSGTSTVTSYIESAVGVEYGSRTGLSSVVVAALFLLALFLNPVIGMVGKFTPITAPALVIVGSLMMRNVKNIVWDDFSEAVPAFLIMIGIPLSYSIADGMAVGFIAYPVIKLLSGRGKDVHWLMYVVAAMFIVRYTLMTV